MKKVRKWKVKYLNFTIKVKAKNKVEAKDKAVIKIFKKVDIDIIKKSDLSCYKMK